MKSLSSLLRFLVFVFFVKPVAFLVLGMNVRHRNRLPENGPAILVANHNSHLDTLVLMSLFPTTLLSKLRPVAAADYFLRNIWLRWFSTQIVKIIPIKRIRDSDADPLSPVYDALNEGDIIIFYPEGTRGEAERMVKFRSGIARLAEKNPRVPIIPIFLYGLGKALPKGEGVLVPFVCDINVGEALSWNGDKDEFLGNLEKQLNELAQEVHVPGWD